MQASDLPAFKFSDIWADMAGGSYITVPIPDTTADPTRASLQQGFPPDTFRPTGAGGNPPFGADFNGILNEITAWLQWTQAGGTLPWDSAFSTAIGGYPKGAVVQAGLETSGTFFVSLVDNNTGDPTGSGASNWFPTSILPYYGLDSSGLGNTIVVTDLPAGTQAGLDSYFGIPITIQKGSATNGGGGCTLNLQGFGAKTIKHQDGSAITTGELVAGGWFTVIWNGGTANYFTLLTSPTRGANPTASAGHVWLAGILIQWIIGPTDPADNSQPSHTLSWDVTFPNSCLIASVSMDLAAASATSDNYYQTAGWNTTQVIVQRQAIASGTFSETTRSIVIGIGN